MNLFNPNETSMGKNQLSNRLPGVVVDDKDPDNRGRVKVSIPGVTNNIENGELPWYNRANGNSSKDELSFNSIPKVGTIVIVSFLSDDIASGVYEYTPVTNKNKELIKGNKRGKRGDSLFSRLKLMSASVASFFNGGLTKNYPDRSAYVSDSGISVTVDKKDNTISVEHPSGTSLTILSDGSIVMASSGKVHVGGVENVTVSSGNNLDMRSDNNTTINAGGNLKISSSSFKQSTGSYSSNSPSFNFNGDFHITGNTSIGGNLSVGGCISSPC